MNYTQFELNLLVDAFKVYTTVAAQQLSPEAVENLANQLGKLLNKITSVQSGQNNQKLEISKPIGISDEWFEKVCKSCNNFKDGNCNDNVTTKFPGKCDPILHYEVSKLKP